MDQSGEKKCPIMFDLSNLIENSLITLTLDWSNVDMVSCDPKANAQFLHVATAAMFDRRLRKYRSLYTSS